MFQSKDLNTPRNARRAQVELKGASWKVREGNTATNPWGSMNWFCWENVDDDDDGGLLLDINGY